MSQEEITYPFPNFNGCTVEVWEMKSNFIPHITNGCDYLYMLELKLIHVSNGRYHGIKCAILQHILMIESLIISEIAFALISQDFIDNKSCDGFVPSGNEPLPEAMLTKFYVAIWHH